MPRPHEDLEHHTQVDHRPGGMPVSFGKGSWVALALVHSAADRVRAVVSSYETLVEHLRATAPPRVSAVFRSENDRRVMIFIEARGHEDFRSIQAAWDDHHLEAKHHAVAESHTLSLYNVTLTVGDGLLDSASHEAYAFERILGEPHFTGKVSALLEAAEGFEAATVLGTGDPADSAVIFRFEHLAQFHAFRSSAAAVALLGESGAPGRESYHIYPVKTFS